MPASRKLEAVADQQEKLMQAQEIQQRQLQEISQRLNSSNYRERVTPPAPYAYP
ncbi:MAG TPA: hypothetical protein VJ698_00980 [Noviherbaspirillum sp.]|uniref:hypothetical protein n=1 Tax=Noviherbaspirillum sp. TaxID=1926288 RepID=UPI002B4A7742|nr:hypothetical protein [Noviherbaspirillum sp.]HJV84021.1 hypothetical protein [Noviherbaspirillum sp.]